MQYFRQVKLAVEQMESNALKFTFFLVARQTDKPRAAGIHIDTVRCSGMADVKSVI
jgi:hypothetical protein